MPETPDFFKKIPELSPDNLVGYVDNFNPLQDLGELLGDVLFPNKDVAKIEYKYLIGAGNAVTMAEVSAHATEAPVTPRRAIDQVTGEIPAIQRKIFKDENDFLTIIKFLKSSDSREQQQAIDMIYDDVDAMINAVWARLEWMRIRAMSLGVLSISNRGIIQSIDFGIPAAQKVTLTGTNRWSDHDNSNPIANIKSWCDSYIAARGFAPTRALTSRTIVNHMLDNVHVRRAIFGDQGATREISLNDLNNLMRNRELPEIATYDLMAQDVSDAGVFTNTRFLPEDRFVMLPPPNVRLGQTLTAPTVEEYLSANLNVRSEGGVVVGFIVSDDPVILWTKGKANKFPTLEGANFIFTSKVY